jgi:dephospho-CoA kinase
MLIGITGTIGAGKGTVVSYLVEQKGFKHFAVSDTFLMNEAKERGLEPTRVARRDIANEFRSRGPTKLMEAVYAMALPAIESGEDVIIEPQHTKAEVEFIQSKGGIVIAVDADLEVRYERIRGRGGPKDGISFEEFKQHHEFEMKQDDPNMNNHAAAIAASDYVVMNNKSIKNLRSQVEKALAEIRHA